MVPSAQAPLPAVDIVCVQGASVVSEQDRRDGFEVGNADKIFMSTSVAAKN